MSNATGQGSKSNSSIIENGNFRELINNKIDKTTVLYNIIKQQNKLSAKHKLFK
jgi:hypothetical protein